MIQDLDDTLKALLVQEGPFDPADIAITFEMPTHTWSNGLDPNRPTINLYLYSVAFVYYDVGYGSAIAIVFFVLIVVLAAILLYLRQRMHWSEAGGNA